MKIYSVGGSVRDAIMGRKSQDMDYVVVGSSHEEMIRNGFTALLDGHFPVYLKNGEEYALARKEVSTGNGYADFDFKTEDVTLEDDLFRRDLTINAIAEVEGEFVDYCGGLDDIKDKVFRHVSDHFKEDPVRALRIARFSARFGPAWSIDPTTMDLIQEMSKRDMFQSLQPERIWKELSRALLEPHPELFFKTLHKMDILHIIFPEIYALLGATEWQRWHPEGNAFEHTMLVLVQARELLAMYKDIPSVDVDPLKVMLCALTHDLGKGITPKDLLPSHRGHETTGIEVIEKFFERMNISANGRIASLCTSTCRWHMAMHNIGTLTAKTFFKIFQDLGCTHAKSDKLDYLIFLAMSDERGRLGSEENEVGHFWDLRQLRDAYKDISPVDVIGSLTGGEKIKAKIRDARITRLKAELSIIRSDG